MRARPLPADWLPQRGPNPEWRGAQSPRRDRPRKRHIVSTRKLSSPPARVATLMPFTATSRNARAWALVLLPDGAKRPAKVVFPRAFSAAHRKRRATAWHSKLCSFATGRCRIVTCACRSLSVFDAACSRHVGEGREIRSHENRTRSHAREQCPTIVPRRQRPLLQLRTACEQLARTRCARACARV